jgi:hypothetical protein
MLGHEPLDTARGLCRALQREQVAAATVASVASRTLEATMRAGHHAEK